MNTMLDAKCLILVQKDLESQKKKPPSPLLKKSRKRRDGPLDETHYNLPRRG